jgi:hypothetical protein
MRPLPWPRNAATKGPSFTAEEERQMCRSFLVVLHAVADLQCCFGTAGWRGGIHMRHTTQAAPQTNLKICDTAP